MEVGVDEAVWIEAIGLVPEVAMAMHGVGGNGDGGPLRHIVAGDLIISQGVPLDDPDGRCQSHGFVEGTVDGLGVGSTAFLLFRMLDEEGEHPAQRVGGCFVAGQEERDRFVVNVVRIGVTRLDQFEQVRGFGRRGAVFDDGGDYFIELAFGFYKLTRLAAGEAAEPSEGFG